jgi:hypothetical protein
LWQIGFCATADFGFRFGDGNFRSRATRLNRRNVGQLGWSFDSPGESDRTIELCLSWF